MPANLASWLGSTVSTAAKPLIDCFFEHATYPFTAGRNVRDLDTNTRAFVGLRDDVKTQIDTARRNGKTPTEEAEAWLKRANKAISDKEENLERYGQRCMIFGWCAPNCWSNYKISKKAADTLKEVGNCRLEKPTNVTQEPPPRPVEHIQVDSVSLKASQISILNQALGYIKDDATVGLVGIWGPRQVGKTLLLKMINNSFGASTDTSEDPTHPSSSTSEQTGGIVGHSTSEIIEEATNTGRSDRQESSFKFVIYVTASINCTVESIQSEILSRLKMQVQDGDSENTRATKISDFLQDKSFLVLLDDLQNDLNLAAVGLPHPLGVRDQLKKKVVITTRSQNLCYNMKTNKDINAPGLEVDEALELFKESAGGGNVYSDPNITAYIGGLVDILRVLPTELMNFGRDMSGKDPSKWQDVIHVIKELIRIQDPEANSLRERIVIKLKEDVKKLREESIDVRDKIELAKENDMVATTKAKTWLSIADSIISNCTAICESERTEANWDICIAATKLREIGECINGRPSVSDIAWPPSVMHIPVDVSLLQPSQGSLVEQVRQHVIDDPEGMTAIWGPVGVGKTLLLNIINNSFEAEDSLTPGSSNTGEPPFDIVIYLKASEECLVGNIQSQIMQRLKMQDGGSVTTRATRICQFLQDKSFLVLLDDLQTSLNLTEVGFPYPLGVQGELNRKVVITTRSQNLCYKMKAKDINAPGLKMHEALELFQGSAGGENVYSDPNIRAHMEDLVNILSVLPTELMSFGREMRGKEEPRQWQDVIHVVKELIKIQDPQAKSLRDRIDIKLKEDVKKLREESSDARDKIELAKENGMVATNKAKTWLTRADSIISDCTAICESERTGANWDICIAATQLREIGECINGRPSVSDIAWPPSVMHITVDDSLLQESQRSLVEQVHQHVIDDPEGMTAILGPVGVGKTLLLKMINNSFETENPLTPSSSNSGDPPFDFVIYLTAPEQSLEQNIQSEIMQRLKMQDNGDSLLSRATRIYKFLQDKNFLVLLDGLETYLDLAAVGFPIGVHGQLKRKVVIATRSQSVCDKMHATARTTKNVLGLHMREALQLFQQIVGCENLYLNPRIGKHAKYIVNVLRARPSELIKFGRELHRERIINPKQWEHVILNKKEYWQQPSRATVFEQAMDYIKDMEYIKHEPVDVIGIWGPGGVGKTHLLKKIQDHLNNSLFDHVIFVTASKECSVQKIQDEILENLKLKKKVGMKAEIISRFLEGKSFVLLLDDLWGEIDLEAVGLPVRHPSRQQKRKVVITTRDRKVCGQMEVRKEISVACLTDDEAWQLFQDKVDKRTLSSSPRIEALAEKLVKELKGLPLALITTGKAMQAKSDPEEWEDAIGYMKNSCCDENDPLSMKSVFKKLKYSYDSLKNDVLKKCFLTCSLWPEDCVIQMEDLYECWMGLGIVDKCDIHACYREVHSIVGELKAACLLETCEYSSWFYLSGRQKQYQQPLSPKASVKMHDVVRDMAIWISNDCGKSNDKWVVRAGIGADSSRNTIPWSKAECVSLMSNTMKKLPPFGSDHCCMKLKTLCLNRNNLSAFIAGSGTSQSLTALTYLDLSSNDLKGISESLCGLKNLEYLNVSDNLFLAEVPVSLSQLKKLKFLYLGATAIRMIPKGIISSLKELKVVDLITNIPPSVGDQFGTDWIIRELRTLANLKAVDIAVRSETEYLELLQDAPNLPIRDLVISSLSKTSGLCLTDGIFSSGIERRTLYQLHIQYCSVEKIIATKVLEPFEALKVLALFHLQDLTEVMWKGSTPQALFPRLTHVDIVSCNKLQHLSWVMYLPCLQYLRVSGCHNMKQAFMSTENYGEEMCRPGQESSRASVDRFPSLIRLRFSWHHELTSLCDSNVTFPSLEILEITDCPKLKKLPLTRQSLPKKLAKLRIDEKFSNEIRSYGLNYAPNSDVTFEGTPGGPMVRVRINHLS